jgi:FixJ family two-component response regulator
LSELSPFDQTIRVLLVDDNEDQAFIATEALAEDPRIDVMDVSSGQARLDQLDKGTFDLVILDYSMPQMTGMDVLRKMRSIGIEVPFIMVTGYGDERVAVEAMKLGASDYIIKSGHYHELLPSIVRRTIELQRHRLELEDQRIRNVRLCAVLETAVTVNHEINSPLVAVIGYAELLNSHIDAIDPSLRTYLQGIMEGSRRIEAVTRRLAQVMTPATKTYLGDVRMLDLDAATGGSLSGSPDEQGQVDD